MDEKLRNELRIKDDQIRNLKAAERDARRKLDIALEDAASLRRRVEILESSMLTTREGVDQALGRSLRAVAA